MKTRKRMNNTALRKDQILKAAVEVAKKSGFGSLTRMKIAEAAGISKSLITYYFAMDELKSAVLNVAIQNEIFPILAHGLCFRKLHLDDALKQKVVKFIST